MARHRLGVWIAIGIAVTALVGGPSIAGAGTPIEAMKLTSEKVILVLNDDELRQPDRAAERRQRLLETVGQRFSYEDMSKRAMGEHWQRLSEEQKREFVGLFQALLCKSYLNKIEGYAGEQIEYLGERLANGYAEVRARLVSAKNDFLLDFRLVDRAGEWLVFDVVVDGVSLINSYRGQFARMLRLLSYDDVIARMREKADVALEARVR